MKVSLSWKIVVGLPETDLDYFSDNKLFNIRTNKSFLGDIGGISSLDFFPYTLEPTNAFYNAIANTKSDNGFIGKKLPFDIKTSKLGSKSNKLKIKIHRFSSNLIIISCSLNSFEFSGESSKLQSLIQLHNHSEIFNFVKVLCGMIKSGGRKNIPIQGKPKAYPDIQIEGDSENSVLQDQYAVEILTRHINARTEIVQSVIDKNRDHQLDSNNILIDRQGILARYTNKYDDYVSIKRKFLSAQNLLELAASLNFIFENGGFEKLTVLQKDAIRKLITTPSTVFSKSVTAHKTWTLLLNEFHLEALFKLTLNQSLNSDVPAINEVVSLETKPEWSELKKWTMGIIGTLLIIFLGWAVNLIYTNNNPFLKEPIGLLAPIDGANFQSDNIIFKWKLIENTKKYILLVEKYNNKNHKWVVQNIGGRYVTIENSYKVTLNRQGKYRWKVSSRDKGDTLMTSSNWHYFDYRVLQTPNKKVNKD